MQAGRRRSHGPALAGIDGLVSVAIRRPILALDVRRQRDVADAIDRARDVAAIVGPQPDRAPPEEVPRQDLAVQLACRRVRRARARPASASGPDAPGLPTHRSLRLRVPTAGPRRRHRSGRGARAAAPEKPCVLFTHEQVAGAQVIHQWPKTSCARPLPSRGGAREPRPSAHGRWLLRDQLIRKLRSRSRRRPPHQHTRFSSCTPTEACTTSSSSEAAPLASAPPWFLAGADVRCSSATPERRAMPRRARCMAT